MKDFKIISILEIKFQIVLGIIISEYSLIGGLTGNRIYHRYLYPNISLKLF